MSIDYLKSKSVRNVLILIIINTLSTMIAGEFFTKNLKILNCNKCLYGFEYEFNFDFEVDILL